MLKVAKVKNGKIPGLLVNELQSYRLINTNTPRQTHHFYVLKGKIRYSEFILINENSNRSRHSGIPNKETIFTNFKMKLFRILLKLQVFILLKKKKLA